MYTPRDRDLHTAWRCIARRALITYSPRHPGGWGMEEAKGSPWVRRARGKHQAYADGIAWASPFPDTASLTHKVGDGSLAARTEPCEARLIRSVSRGPTRPADRC